MFHFYTPWKRQKAWRFQGAYKWDIGLKWVKRIHNIFVAWVWVKQGARREEHSGKLKL